ncbi:hypothetical protein CYY_001579 [Polysphondylium violaceum]|uniref:HD domain-containing protein n=1 Tax=Polysphondylium violaceum TaxID=133409 RepID=A0A8J4V7T4_9MYCE|nr:hypothetical protein CYY_001579 [Polysphondylium violaceum]
MSTTTIDQYTLFKDKLPEYSQEGFDNDYFEEKILEPLSSNVNFLERSSNVLSPTKHQSPIKISSPKPKSSNNDSSDEDDDNNSNAVGAYFCQLCKKRFQNENTWNTHIGSAKHIKLVKESKKKSSSATTTVSTPKGNNNTPTKDKKKSTDTSTPTKTTATTTTTGSNNKQQKESSFTFLATQKEELQKVLKIKSSKPNLACKSLFVIAKAYSQNHYVRDSAKCLHYILDVLSATATTTPSPTPTPTSTFHINTGNIYINATLSSKTNLFLARLCRLFDQQLSDINYIESFYKLNIITKEKLQSLATSLSNNTLDPLLLLNDWIGQITLHQQQVAAEVQDESSNNIDEEKEKKQQQIIAMYNMLNEVAGGLCFSKMNYQSIVLYLLSSSIAYAHQLMSQYHLAIKRIIKLLESSKQYHIVIDLIKNQLILNNNNNNKNNSNSDSNDSTTTLIPTPTIMTIIKYCLVIQDRIRLKDALLYLNNNRNCYDEQDETIQCITSIGQSYIDNDYNKLDDIKDEYVDDDEMEFDGPGFAPESTPPKFTIPHNFSSNLYQTPSTPSSQEYAYNLIKTSKIRKQSKIINDVVHGHMDVPDYILEFVDSEQFQRLRDLKQLGTTSFVFPCGTHTRFEHSLGVSHLAGKWIDKIKMTQPDLEITEDEQKFVRIAGLCHDLGHGPFSHAFESWANTLPTKRFHHEEMSVKMLNWLIDDKGLDYSTDDVKYISNLISGKNRPKERGFIYDIVANDRNSVDVDKFDYLARDSYYLGRSTVCDFTRLIEFSKVIDNEICFCSKEIYNLYELFHTRYSLHKLVYTHKVAKSIEFMISDAFSAADPYLNISDQLEDPHEFINLSDSLLRTIETSKVKELEKSRNIIKNIRNRNLYKFVDEIIVSSKNMPLELAQEIAKEGNGITVDDVIVQNLKLNYAFKDKDPVEHTHFYTRYDDSHKIKIKKEHASHLIPNTFQEERIRVFCRSKDKCEMVQKSFRKVLKNYSITPNPSFTVSPYKK